MRQHYLPSAHTEPQCDDALDLFPLLSSTSIVSPHSVETGALNLRKKKMEKKTMKTEDKERKKNWMATNLNKWKSKWLQDNGPNVQKLHAAWAANGEDEEKKNPFTVGFDSIKFPLNLIQQNCN